MRQVGEPSVEEILESIKKVIARDNRDSAAEARRAGPVRDPAPDQARGQVREMPRIDFSDSGYPDSDETDEVLELGESAELASDDVADDAPLLADNVRQSMQDSLAALSMLAQPGVAPQIVRSGETSLEGMARDLLRPALAEWLDKNLPPLVERMVAAEIARIVGKKA